MSLHGSMHGPSLIPCMVPVSSHAFIMQSWCKGTEYGDPNAANAEELVNLAARWFKCILEDCRVKRANGTPVPVSESIGSRGLVTIAVFG